MSNIALEIKDLVVDYGIIRAIKGINMQVKEGTIVAILGANGAGKSTTIRSVSGIVPIKDGDILYFGNSIKGKYPFDIAQLGLVQSPEGRMILAGLTVEENLKVGAFAMNKKELNVSFKVKQEELMQQVYSYFPILEERKYQEASTLSGGEQQMLAISRALMGNPKILLLDEPSLGLAPLIVQDIFDIISRIKEDGKTIFIVEQNAYQTLKIADYAYVLELGKVSKEGTGEQLLQDDELVNAYLGGKK